MLNKSGNLKGYPFNLFSHFGKLVCTLFGPKIEDGEKVAVGKEVRFSLNGFYGCIYRFPKNIFV